MKSYKHTLEKRLEADTCALALESGRRVGQEGNLKARTYLSNRMKEIGLEAFLNFSYELPYSGELLPSGVPHQFMNLVGVVPGRHRHLAPILIGAHYDSVIDAPCVDDNATSVALNLAIAEAVMKHPLDRDLVIAFFDAEEPPYFLTHQMGSTRFYEDHCKDVKFAGVVVTDLIGHDFCVEDLAGSIPTALKPFLTDLQKTVFVTGAESDGVFPNLIEQLAPKHKGVKLFPTLNSYIGNLSDHHAFEQAGVPFLFFSCAQGKYYHHELDRLDTPDWINFSKLADLTQFISELILLLDTTPAGANPYPSDSLDFELRMIKKVVGKTRLKLASKMLDVEMPRSREDLDVLMQLLLEKLL